MYKATVRILINAKKADKIKKAVKRIFGVSQLEFNEIYHKEGVKIYVTFYIFAPAKDFTFFTDAELKLEKVKGIYEVALFDVDKVQAIDNYGSPINEWGAEQEL